MRILTDKLPLRSLTVSWGKVLRKVILKLQLGRWAGEKLRGKE